MHQDGRALAKLEGLHFHAGDPAGVVVLVARFPKLAVAVDVVATIHLLAHPIGDAHLDQLVKRGLVIVSAGVQDRSDIVGIRQPPGVHREGPFRATLHSSPPLEIRAYKGRAPSLDPSAFRKHGEFLGRQP